MATSPSREKRATTQIFMESKTFILSAKEFCAFSRLLLAVVRLCLSTSLSEAGCALWIAVTERVCALGGRACQLVCLQAHSLASSLVQSCCPNILCFFKCRVTAIRRNSE